MGSTHFSGPVSTPAGYRINPNFDPVYTGPGIINGETFVSVPASPVVTGIPDSTATTIGTITVQNQPTSFAVWLFVRTGITNASHTYDSTRTYIYPIVVTRVPGAATVVIVGTKLGDTIATSSGGQTFTSTVAAAAVSGANTATQTIALQITNVNGSGGTTDAQPLFIQLNGAIFGPTIS
jgi:hypothetical protein